MKKTRLFTILALLAVITLLALVGCNKKEEAVSSISLKDHDPSTALEIALGEFDCSAYTVVVTYESGRTEEIALEEEMIADSDLFLLYQIGEHEITVHYGAQTYTFRASVKRATFGELAFPSQTVFTYDGKAHTVEVDGNIPANAVVTYPGGNSFVNAGIYDVTAIVTCEGYVTEKLSTTVTVKRAAYDMSGVRFEGKEVVYDGNPHAVAISGTLPKGVSAPTYTINGKVTASATDVGEYQVKAAFASTDPNYEAIPEMVTTLKITPAEYAVKGVDIVFKNENGKVINDAAKIYDGRVVTFDLNDYSKLSKKVSVSFFVYDQEGKVISTSNMSTNMVNAGRYTVKAEFSLANGKNYKPIEPVVRTFDVLKADHPPLANVSISSAQFMYDKHPHALTVFGELPEGVKVTYEYYLNGTLVTDGEGKAVQSVTNVGIYVVKAVFTHQNENFGKIADMYASLSIKKSEVDTSMVGFFGENSTVYNGQTYVPPFTTWRAISGTDYDLLQYSPIRYYMLDGNGQYAEMGENELPLAAGLYRFAIDISIAEAYKENCVLSGGESVRTIVKQFEIKKQGVAVPVVDFTSDAAWDYTGVAEAIDFACNADPTLVTISTGYFRYAAGEYLAMPSGVIPVDAGSYRYSVTVALRNADCFVFADGKASATYSFDFEIRRKTVDVSGIRLSQTALTYDGLEHVPSLVNVPAHVLPTLQLYTEGGREPIAKATNAGKYRVEVALAAENANFLLSSGEKLVFALEILHAKINVDGLVFDATEFTYNGEGHYPSLQNVPQHVQQTVRLCSIVYADISPVDQAINAGKYSCEVRLVAENANYILVGQTVYTTEFSIHAQHIANLDEALDEDIVLSIPADGYTSETLAEAICDALFGDNSQRVTCYANTPELADNGQIVLPESLAAEVRYKVTCRVDINAENDGYNYSFLYNGRSVIGTEITVYFVLNG